MDEHIMHVYKMPYTSPAETREIKDTYLFPSCSFSANKEGHSSAVPTKKINSKVSYPPKLPGEIICTNSLNLRKKK